MSLFRNNKPYLTARTSTGVTSYRNSFYLLAERAKSRNEALAAKLAALQAAKLPAQTEFVSPIMVCQSAAGYYIGHLYADTTMGMLPTEFALPWSRESDYFATHEEAAAYLAADPYWSEV